MDGRIESLNTNPQAIELDPSSIGQAYSNNPRTVGYENMEPECIFTVLRVPSEILSLSSADAWFSKVVNRFRVAGTNKRLDLRLSWRASETHLKDHIEYDQGPEPR